VELPPATPWRRYLAWLHARDAAATEAFWREELAGIDAAALPRFGGAGGQGGETRLELTPSETRLLDTTARERRVTLNTLVSAAWALWLARATGRSDVVFGVATAGRPEEVPGIADLVGMCINNVPARVRLEPAAPLDTLLQQLSRRQAARAAHDHATLIDLQRWSDLPWHQRLFDTLVVFQHHRADEDSAGWMGPTVGVRVMPGETQTNYPLALVVSGAPGLALRLAYQGRFADVAAADQVLAEVRTLLMALASEPDRPLVEVLELIPARERPDSQRDPQPASLPARNATEWVVARIWAELLGRDEVGIDQNFFDLGGQSLVATQIVSRVRDTLRLEVPVSLLFEQPTVEAFAAAVAAREPSPGQVERIATLTRRVEEMSIQELKEAGVHE
jgi:acyl carrier protein